MSIKLTPVLELEPCYYKAFDLARKIGEEKSR